MSEKYMKIIETLGEVLIDKELSISLLKYENEKLKNKLETIEKYVEYYDAECE